MAIATTLPPVASFREEVEAMVSIALAAGEIAMRHYAGEIQVDFKGYKDPVTAADREINTFVVNRLREQFPKDAVLAEESADEPERRLGNRRLWCVDPLDGTQEFTEHIDQWAVMIGLAVAGMATAGVVYCPPRNLLMVGVVSEGAWAWQEGTWHPLQVSDVRDTREATIAVSRSHRSDKVDAIMRALGITREIRHGSVGMKVSLLATRQADLYIHPTPGTKEWDLCAPEAILRAAGGEMTDMYGRPLRYNNPDPRNPHGLVASNGYLHAVALDAVKAVIAKKS